MERWVTQTARYCFSVEMYRPFATEKNAWDAYISEEKLNKRERGHEAVHSACCRCPLHAYQTRADLAEILDRVKEAAERRVRPNGVRLNNVKPLRVSEEDVARVAHQTLVARVV
jgi:hypothetical protein